ncbi:hypothetical protein M231_08030 [Tremella mesenterica]|uniref:OTU domain-containing protein n=1 Tax=Tremella mesenterica TaxID=5217 RepID=A0A4Q1BAM4_TREME|nr:hypothetical protein M231_08030 [Tremella mesenterica]
MSATTPSQTIVGITALPFLQKFHLFSRLSSKAQGTVMSTLQKGPQDVDKWEISMSPSFYGGQFGSSLAVVKLSSHQPKLKTTNEGDRGHEFSNWLLLAECTHQLWVDTAVKDSFFRELKRWRMIQPADVPWVATYGSAHVPVSLLVHCLNKAQCPTIHLKSYGQKLPLVPELLGTDPAEVSHPLSHLNQWDIGVTYKSPHIFLFAPLKGTTKEMSLYPMIVPGSLDYGSILVDIVYKGTNYKVKIYPRLVHLIKSFNSRIQGDIPRTMDAVRKRGKACFKMIHRMGSVPQWDMGGFRLEVTVQARSLASARRKVEGVPFLDINFWRDPGTHPQGHSLERFKVDIKVLSKAALLMNAHWVYQRAMDMGIFRGDSNIRPSRGHLQGITDVLASFGWNAGRRNPSKSLNPHAWWTGDRGDRMDRRVMGQLGTINLVVPLGGLSCGDTFNSLSTLSHLTQKFKGKTGVQQLLKILRHMKTRGSVPCPKGDTDNKHRMNIHGWKPLRMKCGLKSCHFNMDEAHCFKWFAALVDRGHVSREAVGMSHLQQRRDPPIHVPSPEPEEPLEDKVPQVVSLPPHKRRRLDDAGESTRTSRRFNKNGRGHIVTDPELQTTCPIPGLSPDNLVPLNLLDTNVPQLYHTRWTKSDGNCQFSAFARALQRDHVNQKQIRATVVQWIRDHSEDFIGYVPGGTSEFNKYLGDISKNGTWGDNLTLQAACAAFKVCVLVLKEEDDGRTLWVEVGSRGESEAVFWLYLYNSHYENLVDGM